MGTPSQNFAPSVALFEQTLEEAFPDVDSLHRPFGSKVIVQIRTAKETTKGGIIIPDEARTTIAANTQVGKVVAIGPMAFKNPRTGEPWAEGPWFKVGDYVRCPKYGGDRFEIPNPKSKGEVVMFVVFDHLQFTCEALKPLEIIAFV